MRADIDFRWHEQPGQNGATRTERGSRGVIWQTGLTPVRYDRASAMALDDVLVILLAGGAGERLHPLTAERAKPAVYFGGPYRIIDFTLSNCINSGFRRIFIATQYKSLSLTRHIRMGWKVFAEELGEFIEILPPQKRVGEHWYLGTADAVYQNLYSITRES